MPEGNTIPETSAKGLRNFIAKAKQIKEIRNRGRAKNKLNKREHVVHKGT